LRNASATRYTFASSISAASCPHTDPSCIAIRNLLEDCRAFKCGYTNKLGQLRDVVQAYPEVAQESDRLTRRPVPPCADALLRWIYVLVTPEIAGNIPLNQAA
jgi:hypothetical protein